MSRKRRNSRFFIRLADLLDCLAVRLDQLDYDLPSAQIAQRPLPHRDSSRLLAMDRASGKLGDRMFAELPSLLRGNELIVLNNARVIPARLFGHRLGVFSDAPSHATRHEHLSGTVEVFLARQVGPDVWEALVRPGRKMKTGERVVFGEGEPEAEIIARRVRTAHRAIHLPLPGGSIHAD